MRAVEHFLLGVIFFILGFAINSCTPQHPAVVSCTTKGSFAHYNYGKPKKVWM